MPTVKATYEAVFIFSNTLGEDGIVAVKDKFEKLIADNAELGKVDEWGTRRLAYPINYKTEGYYVLVNFESEAAFPAELDRVFGITEGILRHMTLKLDGTDVKEVEAPAEIAESSDEE